jgi:hypothetical protein
MLAGWVTLFEGILLLFLVAYLVWWFAAKKRTPMYVKVLTGVGWFLGFALILFIPLDIYIVGILIILAFYDAITNVF